MKNIRRLIFKGDIERHKEYNTIMNFVDADDGSEYYDFSMLGVYDGDKITIIIEREE